MSEILIAEIYELKINNEQKKELRKIMNQNSDKYIWINEDTILKQGVTNQDINVDISETSEWIL